MIKHLKPQPPSNIRDKKHFIAAKRYRVIKLNKFDDYSTHRNDYLTSRLNEPEPSLALALYPTKREQKPPKESQTNRESKSKRSISQPKMLGWIKPNDHFYFMSPLNSPSNEAYKITNHLKINKEPIVQPENASNKQDSEHISQAIEYESNNPYIKEKVTQILKALHHKADDKPMSNHETPEKSSRGDLESSTETTNEDSHEVWDNTELFVRGVDIENDRDPSGKDFNFFNLYKARYGQFPNKRSFIDNNTVIDSIRNMGCTGRPIKNAGKYPWYTFDDTIDYSRPVKSDQNLGDFLSHWNHFKRDVNKEVPPKYIFKMKNEIKKRVYDIPFTMSANNSFKENDESPMASKEELFKANAARLEQNSKVIKFDLAKVSKNEFIIKNSNNKVVCKKKLQPFVINKPSSTKNTNSKQIGNLTEKVYLDILERHEQKENPYQFGQASSLDVTSSVTERKVPKFEEYTSTMAFNFSRVYPKVIIKGNDGKRKNRVLEKFAEKEAQGIESILPKGKKNYIRV